MGYLPICVDLKGRNCLVLGGGTVAERKAATLLELEACVKVISPRLTARLQRWALEEFLQYERRTYERGDLIGQEMVFVATNDKAVNQAVATEASRYGIWVNAADDPAHCDFILPSILRRGRVAVAVSTGGASPTLARLIRERLEDQVTDNDEAVAEFAAEVRRELRERSQSPTATAWRSALAGSVRVLAATGDRDAARAHLRCKLMEEVSPREEKAGPVTGRAVCRTWQESTTNSQNRPVSR